jgi:hypothetical protein
MLQASVGTNQDEVQEMTEFKAFPKIPRLNREMVVTEKIDGTNVCVVVDGDKVSAQSRNRIITSDDDNYGFAAWVQMNSPALAVALGDGYHYGEWWGQGIQRKYGMDHKRFSLFNVHRWVFVPFSEYGLDNVGIVPILYRGPFDTDTIDSIVGDLILNGSTAAPGFMKPEGVIIWHEAAQQMFKVTCEGDEKPKGQQ